MRTVLSEKPLPKCWRKAYKADASLLLEKDIPLASLRLKLLVFKDPKSLRRFWRKAAPLNLGGMLPSDALGAVAPLSSTVYNFEKTQWPEPYQECDRRYFAAMGLAAGHLGSRIVTHECVHAGFFYARRMGARSVWSAEAADGTDDELVCYPAGELANRVVTALYKAGLCE